MTPQSLPKCTLHRAVLKDGNGGQEAADGDLHHRALKCAYRQGLAQDGNGAFAGGKQKFSLLLAGESPGKQHVPTSSATFKRGQCFVSLVSKEATVIQTADV